MVFLVFICTGNVVVITAVMKYKKLRTISNVFVAGLAVADLSYGMIVLPVKIAVILLRIHFQKGEIFYELTRAVDFIETGSVSISMWVLQLAGIEKYIAICHPFYYLRKYTIPRAIASVVAVAILQAALQVPPALSTDDYKINKEYEHILAFNYSNEINDVNGVFLLLMLTTVIYVRIAWVAFKQKRAIAALHSSVVGGPNTRNKDARIVRMLATVLGCIYACWIPFIILTYIFELYFFPLMARNDTSNHTMWFNILYIVRSLFPYLNSMLNPFIFAGMNKDFKGAFYKLLLRKTHEDQQSGATDQISGGKMCDARLT